LALPLRLASNKRNCLLHPASCLLPPASCHLPPATCFLPPDSCRCSRGWGVTRSNPGSVWRPRSWWRRKIRKRSWRRIQRQ
jgi:hypothetical protein